VILPSGGSLEEFQHGQRIVLFVKVFPDLARSGNLDAIARANGLHLLCLREPDGLFSERWNATRLEREYRGNARLRAHYSDLLAIARQRNPNTILVMGDGGYWHPELVAELRKQSTVAFWTGDDPEGSEQTSRPFVQYYDYAFCGGIFYSSTQRIAEQFVSWGARRSRFIPLGACPDKYLLRGDKSDADFFEKQRDIDLIYVGSAYRSKLWRILTIKRHFRDRLLLAGRRWDGKGLGWKGVAVRLFARIGGLGQIRTVTDAELVSLYQRARVGFNCHLSYGPSNLRLYELPLNGVMQICDCPEGLSELYELNREVVAYETTREAIDRIEHFLDHDDERIEIAKNGYLRAEGEYRMEKSFARLFAALDEDRNAYVQDAGGRLAKSDTESHEHVPTSP
jgi:spore maturation protein CgeB